MFTVTPEIRHDHEAILCAPIEFSNWNHVVISTVAFAKAHLNCFEDSVFFKIEKTGADAYLWRSVRFATKDTDSLIFDQAWYC